MSDLLIRAVNRPQAIRVVAAVSTDLCRTAAARHQTSPAVACALGRGLTAGLLLATLTRGGERVTIQLTGDGPLKGLTIDAYDDGDVRGYPVQPRAWPDQGMKDRLRLADLVGHDGVVNVMRDVGLRERYQGQVPLSTGEVDEDVEAFLRVSEQIPSALGCDVVMDEAGQVIGAGGLLAQVMPGGHEETIRELQHALRTGGLYRLLQEAGEGAAPLDLMQRLLPGLSIEPLDQRELRFRCRCGTERIEGMLLTLGQTDLDEMIAEGQAEVTCNYCNQVYLINQDTLQRIRERVKPRENN